jgi:tRNA (cmo5U34)-methyltransferase
MRHLNNKFDFSTIKDFDNHISNSIQGYDVLHSLILNISSFFIKKNVVPIDLGCTSGLLIKAIQNKYNCKCIGYDITDNNFIEGYDLRLADLTDNNFLIPETNLIFSVFTLQFIDYKYRLNILKKVYNSLYKNGAFIYCEKEICSNGIIQEVFTFSNYSNKRNNFSAEEILNKESDLRNIMNPLECKDNIELLKKSGFKIIEPFFQSLNFKGYICKK